MMEQHGNEKTTISSTDSIIYINYGLNLISKKGIVLLLKSKILKKEIIVHWIGSDIYSLFLNNSKSKMKKNLTKMINKYFSINNWVAAPLLKQELKNIGIESELVYIPTELVRNTEVKPLPSSRSLISYLPKGNHEFYGSKLIFKLAENNPEVKIHIVANDGEKMPTMQNVIYHGWVNEATMNRLYNESYGVIRLPIHDALGGTVIEAVLRGRYAVWTFEAEYVFSVKNYAELEKAVCEIFRKTEPNFSGAQYINDHFNYEKLKTEFVYKVNQVANK